jgi:hypothetical protein
MRWESGMKLFDKLRLFKKFRRRGIGRDESGVTAIEFAILAPVFFLTFFSMFETGLILFTEYVLQSSTSEAARLVRTGQAQGKGMSASQFKTEVCKIASLLIDCNGKVTVYMKAASNFNSLSSSPSYLAIGPSATGVPSAPSFACGGPGQMVALIATYDYHFVWPAFMQWFGNINGGTARRVAGFAMFRNEPYTASSKTC